MESDVIEAKKRTSFRKEVITALQNAAERLRKMKTEFLIEFGKSDVGDNFDNSCFSGVVGMKVCLE